MSLAPPLLPSMANRPASARRAVCLLLLACTGIISARAQNVILTPEREQTLTAAQRKESAPPPPSRPPVAPETPYRLGPVTFRPRLSYGFLSADGIPTRSGARVTSETHTLATGFSADLGDYWAFSYGPTWTNQSAAELGNTVDHFASLVGARSFAGVGIQFSQSFSKSTPTSIETGSQTEEETWSTTLGANYSLSPRIQLSGSASMNERYTSVSPMIRGWMGSTALSWSLTNRLSLSFAPSFGYNEVRDGPDTYNENYTGRMNWRPTDKLSLSAGAGRQFTHSRSSAAIDLKSPVADFTLGYTPFQTTSISLAVTQSVAPTYQANRVSENYRWNFGLQQRLLGKVYASLSYSRHRNDYAATDLNALISREDLVQSYSLRLSTRVLKKLSLSVNLQQNKNTSNVAAFSFSSRQYGADVSWAF